MTPEPEDTARVAMRDETACWNHIGVQGDRSCPELAEHVHCRNCPVYATAASAVLDGELSDETVRERTRHFAAPKKVEGAEAEPVVVFRVASEWLALPMSMVAEVAETRPIRTLPHHKNGSVLGVANVRGELLACVSLPRLLALDRTSGDSTGAESSRRLLVIRSEDVRVVAVVDEVGGIHRFLPSDVREVPGTVARAPSAHSRAVISWSNRSVGLLDGPRLLRSVRGGLS